VPEEPDESIHAPLQASAADTPGLRRVLLQSTHLLTGQSIALILAFVQGVMIARYLGPSDLGVVAIVTTLVLTLHQLVDSRAWEATIRWASQFLEAGDRARATATFKAAFILDAVTAVLALGVALAASELAEALLIQRPGAGEWIRLYSISILISFPLGSATALLRLDGRFLALSIQTGVAALLRLCGVLIVVILHLDIQALLLAYVLSSALATVFLLSLLSTSWRRLELLPLSAAPIRLLRGHGRVIGRFLAATNASALVKTLQRNADVLMAGHFLGSRAVGQLRVAKSASDLLAFPTGPLYQVSYPRYVQLWHQGHRAELRGLALRLTLVSIGVAAVGVLPFLIAGDAIVRILVGEAYLPAVPVLQWLAVGVGIAVATNAIHPLLLTIGRAGVSLLGVAVGALAQVILLALFLPRVGIIVAGVSYIVFYLAWCFVTVPVVFRELRRPVNT
jgi:O-antigen/teichoic acid export membrane protein